MNERKILTDYVYTIVSSFVQNGINNVVISPGSRSTPLAYAFQSTKEMTVYRQVDERAAAFFALGLAKATGKSTVLLCTSGTAAANYYPAIVEAKYARIPLIILTADRPHELREVGAPQAIDQIRMYGEHVKWSVDFPIPDNSKMTLPFIERHIARAVNVSNTYPHGPVHINVPFREPLLIDFQESLPNTTYQQSYISDITPSKEAQQHLTNIINETKKGIFIIGELPLNSHSNTLWSIIRKAKWPVLIESLSNMRSEIPEDCLPYCISTYDALLKSESFKEKVIPHTVIRFGAQPVSKFLMNFITESLPNNYVIIDESPIFRDSTSVSTLFIHGTISDWLKELPIISNIDEQYVFHWQKAETNAKSIIEKYSNVEHDEGAFVQNILRNLPNSSDVFVSNSMPIRDIDTFFLPTEKDVKIFANRGTNGIDGVMSTAIGFSKGRQNRNMYLLIGDLAFLHDINGLVATRYQQCNITIFVLNNDGGGIFSYLSQATVKQYYEDLFGTPTSLTFEKVAEMYDMEYKKIEHINQLTNFFNEEPQKPLRLVEIFTDRTYNVEAHRKLWKQIHSEL